MHMLAARTTYRHATLSITTQRPTEFIDITTQVEGLIAEAGVQAGFVVIQTLHTTTAVVVNEHEPLLLSDFAALLEQVAPVSASYRHDDPNTRTVNLSPGERANGHAHCRALFLASFAVLNIDEGRLQLGRWQRVFFAELDGPRTRKVSVMLAGDGMR